jgi:hypothetical protein
MKTFSKKHSRKGSLNKHNKFSFFIRKMLIFLFFASVLALTTDLPKGTANIPTTMTEDEIMAFYKESLASISNAVSVEYFPGKGWGVRTYRRLEYGDRIMNILPKNCLHIYQPFPLLKDLSDLGPEIILTMHILWDRFTKKKPDTFLSKYIHSLNVEIDNEIVWTDEDKMLFEKYSLTTYRLASEDDLEANIKNTFKRLEGRTDLHPGILNRDNFLWAFAHYKSRNHSFAVAEWKKMLNLPVTAMDFLENTHVLLPCFDLLNHEPLAGSARSLDLERPFGLFQRHGLDPTIELRVDRNYMAGDEVFYEYDANKSTMDLVLAYGFSMDKNVDDKLLFILTDARLCHGTWIDEGICQYELKYSEMSAVLLQHLREIHATTLLPEISASRIPEFYTFLPVGNEKRNTCLRSVVMYRINVLDVLGKNVYGLR